MPDALTTTNSPAPTLRTRILAHFPPGQFIRYIGVGVFNTGFGYGLFALFNFLLHKRRIPASYIYAAILSNLISITVAYLGYKFFVFRTKGNYLREWMKAVAVYGTAAIPGLIVLAPLVRVVTWLLPHQLNAFHRTVLGKDAAPYIANALLTGFTVIYSFFGHKKVTFRERKA